MNSDNVKTLKRAVPLGVFALAGWYTYKKRENIQESILFGGIVALLAYLLLGPLVDKIITLSGRPSEGRYETGNIPRGWNPESITRELWDNIDGLRWSFNTPQERDLYMRLAALNDDQLVAVYNFWRSNYYDQDKQTLTQAMMSENYGMAGLVPDTTNRIISRLKARQCY